MITHEQIKEAARLMDEIPVYTSPRMLLITPAEAAQYRISDGDERDGITYIISREELPE
jgi:hypothetical protein